MNFNRALDIQALIQHRSLFLLGPRQTGKTTYLKQVFPRARYIDLLDARVFRDLSTRPELLRESLGPQDQIVIIDEIQKSPKLLDEVQLLIERNKKLRFILTGSSARKLKRGRANLLGGRALTVSMHPLTSPELGFKFLDKRLAIGNLPHVFNSPLPYEDLIAYVGTYLQEEIQAEGLARNIEGFARFLETAALSNGQLVNFTAMGSDAGIPPRTVQNYYQVLVDTLLGYFLPPWRGPGRKASRKAIATAKFYMFDIGVVHALLKRFSLSPKTPEYGAALEHLIFLELRAYLDNIRSQDPLYFWRTHTNFEVDFIIPGKVAIEVKSKERVAEKDLRGLQALQEFSRFPKRIVVSHDWQRTTEDAIQIIPVHTFLKELWAGNII